MFHCARRKCVSYRNLSSTKFRTSTRQLSGGSSSNTARPGQRRLLNGTRILAIATASTAVALYNIRTKPVLNDAASPAFVKEIKPIEEMSASDREHLTTLAFGSNREGLLSPEHPAEQAFRTPTSVKWLHDTPLRDLVLHEKYAACIDVKGDVYMWGSSTKGDSEEAYVRPTLILKGRDIVSLQASEFHILALSSSGKIFSLRTSGGRSTSATETPSSSWNPLTWVLGTPPSIGDDVLELLPAEKLRRGERFVAISSGAHHALALTSDGRTYSHPLSEHANDCGQLGQQRVNLYSQSSAQKVSGKDETSTNLIPRLLKDPHGKSTAFARIQSSEDDSASGSSERSQGGESRYCAELYEVPSLRGIRAAQAIAGARTSFVRTADEGRVLAWGANQFGQLGLGSTVTVDSVLVPTEVLLARSSPRGARSRCVDITTGGDVTFFTVEQRTGSSSSTDLLACGMGQWGTLGNGTYSSAQGDPTRIRAVSGLMEYSDKTNSLQPIVPYALSASEAPMGHVLLTLDTLERAGNDFGGRDLLVWGNGRDYQLGNERRSSLASPTALDVNATKSGATGSGKKDDSSAIVEYTSALPNRLMLSKRQASVVRDMEGNILRRFRGAEVEQRAVAGFGASVIYWKISAK